MSSPSAVNRSARPGPHAGPGRPRSGWRWVSVLVLVIGLHWLAAQWVERVRGFAPVERPVHVPVQVALLKPERVAQQPAQTAAPATPAAAPAGTPHPHVMTATQTPEAQANRTAQARRAAAVKAAAVKAAETRAAEARAAAAARLAQLARTEAAARATAAAQAAAAQAEASAAAAAASRAAAAAAANASAAAAVRAAHAAPGVRFSVPPSGNLQYDTFYNGVRNEPGTIRWESHGGTYRMVVSMPLPFVGTFTYESRGHIDAWGLAPDEYIEKRGRRPEDVSVFNRTSRQIEFTRTPTRVPMPDGAQDRFSMVMQLASLVRGDPDVYRPGVTRQFFVVDNDSGEIWPIETIGDESVGTPHGFVMARHFMRLPRHPGDRRRIDVWLAPALGWLPVRLVQTEPNGTQIELLWRGSLREPDSGAAAPAAGHGATPATDASGVGTTADTSANATASPNAPPDGQAAPPGAGAGLRASGAPATPAAPAALPAEKP